jgi:hypothetical protein
MVKTVSQQNLLPPLETGDRASADLSVRLTGYEFEQCYNAMP